MSKTITEIIEEANTIATETVKGKNTAERVGGCIKDAAEYVQDFAGAIKEDVESTVDAKMEEVDEKVAEKTSAISELQTIVEGEGDYVTEDVANSYDWKTEARSYDCTKLLFENSVNCYCYLVESNDVFKFNNLSNSAVNQSARYVTYNIPITKDDLNKTFFNGKILTDYLLKDFSDLDENGKTPKAGSYLTEEVTFDFSGSGATLLFLFKNTNDESTMTVTRTRLVRSGGLQDVVKPAVETFNNVTNLKSKQDMNVVMSFFEERAKLRDNYITDTSKTIYVDSESGSDDNDGLSISNPINSLTKLSSIIADGDTILFKRGSNFFVDSEINIKNNGLYIDCYGSAYSDDQTTYIEKPIFNNLNTITDATVIEKVSGYDNIYRIPVHWGSSFSGARRAIQVFIDDKVVGDWTTYCNYYSSGDGQYQGYDCSTEAGALTYMDAFKGNSAWASMYDNNGFADGWDEGDYYIYFSALFDATNQTELDNHTLQISRGNGQVIYFGGTHIDMRNVIYEAPVRNDTDLPRYVYAEGIELRDNTRHGFLFYEGKFLNCTVSTRGGVGACFHYFGDKTSMDFDLAFIGCKVFNYNYKNLTPAFYGHASSTLDPYSFFNKAYIKDCYIYRAGCITNLANVGDTYIDNITIVNVRQLCIVDTNVHINNIVGTVMQCATAKNNGTVFNQDGLFQNGRTNAKLEMKNARILVNSYNGSSFLLYSYVAGMSIDFDNVSILINKHNTRSSGYGGFSTKLMYFQSDSLESFVMKKSLIGIVDDLNNTQYFSWVDNDDRYVPSCKDCVFVGMQNNTGALTEQTWITDADELYVSKYFPRLMSARDGVVNMMSVDKDTYSVSGNILSIGGNSVSSLSIALTDGFNSYTATTDSDGAFVIDGIKNGVYYMVVDGNQTATKKYLIVDGDVSSYNDYIA